MFLSVPGHFVAEIHLVPTKELVAPLSAIAVPLGFGIPVGVVLGIWQGSPKAIGLELSQETLVLGHVEILFENWNDALSIVCDGSDEKGKQCCWLEFVRSSIHLENGRILRLGSNNNLATTAQHSAIQYSRI